MPSNGDGNGYLDPTISPCHIDAVITPIYEVGLPFTKPFINGRNAVEELVSKFNPDYILASTLGGNIEYSGILNLFLKRIGTFNEIKQRLPSNTILIDPIQFTRYPL